MKQFQSRLDEKAPAGMGPWGVLQVGRIILFGAALLASGMANAQGVSGSKHDLSGLPPSWFGSDPNITSQVCMFCHTPHHANNTLSDINAPLWNRAIDRTKVYATYSSPSMAGSPGNPTLTISVLCLGCHDGTLGVASSYGFNFSDKHSLINGDRFNPPGVLENCASCHSSGGMGPAKPTMMLGPDLSNDHPIAVAYPTGLGSRFRTPPDPQSGWSDARLYNGKVECPSCHKVHDPSITPFLRKSNAGSALCLTCHVK